MLGLAWRKDGAEGRRQFDTAAELDAFEERLLADGWEPDPRAARHCKGLRHQDGDFLHLLVDGAAYRAVTAGGMGCRVWDVVREAANARVPAA